jgi:hypothetical protein
MFEHVASRWRMFTSTSECKEEENEETEKIL